MLGNEPHSGFYHIRDYVTVGIISFRIMSQLGFCRSKLSIGVMSFGIMSYSGLCRIRYCVVLDCVVLVTVARVYVIRDYVFWLLLLYPINNIQGVGF